MKAIVLVLSILILSILADPSWASEFQIATPDRAVRGSAANNAFADSFWIVVLCLFSIALRFGKHSRSRWRLFALLLLLSVLAAIHSHPLWNFSTIGAPSTQDSSTIGPGNIVPWACGNIPISEARVAVALNRSD
jgi:hypothetical protein